MQINDLYSYKWFMLLVHLAILGQRHQRSRQHHIVSYHVNNSSLAGTDRELDDCNRIDNFLISTDKYRPPILLVLWSVQDTLHKYRIPDLGCAQLYQIPSRGGRPTLESLAYPKFHSYQHAISVP